MLACNTKTWMNGRDSGCELKRFIPFRPAGHSTDFRISTQGHGLHSSLCKPQAMPGKRPAKAFVFHSSMEIWNLMLNSFWLFYFLLLKKVNTGPHCCLPKLSKKHHFFVLVQPMHHEPNLPGSLSSGFPTDLIQWY